MNYTDFEFDEALKQRLDKMCIRDRIEADGIIALMEHKKQREIAKMTFTSGCLLYTSGTRYILKDSRTRQTVLHSAVG